MSICENENASVWSVWYKRSFDIGPGWRSLLSSPSKSDSELLSPAYQMYRLRFIPFTGDTHGHIRSCTCSTLTAKLALLNMDRRGCAPSFHAWKSLNSFKSWRSWITAMSRYLSSSSLHHRPPPVTAAPVCLFLWSRAFALGCLTATDIVHANAPKTW